MIIKKTYLYLMHFTVVILVLILCIACSAAAPADEAVKKDWESYCRTVLKESLNCSDMRIVDKKMAGDDCEVLIAAKAVKETERESVEIKFKFTYKKFDNGWTAIGVDRE